MSRLGWSVGAPLETIWLYADRKSEFRANDLVISPRRIVRAAAELEEAIRTASKGARRLIWAALTSDSDRKTLLVADRSEENGGVVRRPTIDDYGNLAKQLAEITARVVNLPRDMRPTREGGTAPRSYLGQLFVKGLLTSVDEAGGTLTLDKNLGEGTLIEALSVLKPYLPQEFRITEVSPSTLQRWKTDWTKSQQNVARRS